jgi:hypothetical protein
MRTTRRTIAYAVALVASAALGWWARAPAEAEAPAPTPDRATRVSAQPSTDHEPLIAVASDGNVTLRVEQQPLEWVLEQIAAQSARADVKSRARPPAAADAGRPCSEAVACTQAAAPPVDAARLLQAIERGSEAERFEGLLRARSSGVTVPEQTLKSLYETDASEQVRVAAFEGYLELRIDPRDLRQTLETALYLPSAAILREAARRLEELREIERTDALALQGDP